MTKKAIFSPCRKYRYALWRTWDESKGTCGFIGLNPSTADETQDDPTIRRCIGFAKSWGYGSLMMVNLFAFRATKPKDMFDAEKPIGTNNNGWILACFAESKVVIAAWGNGGAYMDRGAYVIEMGIRDDNPCKYLSLTKQGEPGHPLYLKANLKPLVFTYVEKTQSWLNEFALKFSKIMNMPYSEAIEWAESCVEMTLMF